MHLVINLENASDNCPNSLRSKGFQKKMRSWLMGEMRWGGRREYILSIASVLNRSNARLGRAQTVDSLASIWAWPIYLTKNLVNETEAYLLDKTSSKWGRQTLPWSSSKIIGMFVGFGLCLIGFCIIQWKLDETATIPLKILRQRLLLMGSFLFFFGMTVYVVRRWNHAFMPHD